MLVPGCSPQMACIAGQSQQITGLTASFLAQEGGVVRGALSAKSRLQSEQLMENMVFV